ncbi:hypothetical protein KUCAC02_027820 [Chaenocephalus aceratus]|nr:hypothetical protein KUCAC02_027820 [Chaenocephalus aceratus]
MATVLHDAIMNPAEVVKQRMQMFNSPYRGVLHCMGSLWRHDGPAAFYRSYTTQLTMNVPFQALHFMTYEYLQELLNPHRQYNPSSHVVSGALAGAIAAAVTTPLTMGGVPAFFKGVQARIIYQMPSTAISWSVYEFFKYIITKRQHERRLRGDGDK